MRGALLPVVWRAAADLHVPQDEVCVEVQLQRVEDVESAEQRREEGERQVELRHVRHRLEPYLHGRAPGRPRVSSVRQPASSTREGARPRRARCWAEGAIPRTSAAFRGPAPARRRRPASRALRLSTTGLRSCRAACGPHSALLGCVHRGGCAEMPLIFAGKTRLPPRATRPARSRVRSRTRARARQPSRTATALPRERMAGTHGREVETDR